MRQHRYQKAVKHPARIPPPPARRVPPTPHRRVVPPCGRDVPPQAPGSGEASPHTPPPTAEPASPLRSDPPKGRLHCAALLSLCSVRTLPHRSPSLHAAHRLRRLTGRLLPAILLRRCLPSRNTCKLYVAHGNMVIDHITMSYELALCWTALPDSPTKNLHRGFRARCRNRIRDSHGPSGLCMLQTLGVLPGAARAL